MADADKPRQTHRVLVIAESEQSVDELTDLLRERGSVVVVRPASEALATLQTEHIDLVLSPPSELLPVARAASREQRRQILDSLTQGVCVFDRQGRLVWSNTVLRSYPEEVAGTMREACVKLVTEFEADPSHSARGHSFAVGQQYFFDLSATALRDARGNVDRIIAMVSDVTAITRLRQKIDAIDAAGRQLVQFDADQTAQLDVPERLRLLEENVVRFFSDPLHFTHFTVRVLDPTTNRLDTVLAGGISEQAKELEIHAVPEGSGISGRVATTGESYICPDISKDPLYLPGFESARSSLTVPLRLDDRIVGVLNVESDEPAAFTEEDRQLAEIFSRYIALALQMLKLLAAERSETTGQVAADVRAELSEPLNEIIAEVTRLLQSDLEPEAMRQRLRKIIEDVDLVKRSLRAVTEPVSIRGLVPEGSDTIRALEGKRVLIADDEDIIRETISDVLSKGGAITVMARDGEEAVAMIQAQQFDMVLSDIKMPYKSGYEVFAAANEVQDHCPVILITGFGYDPEHSIVRASGEGLAGVLFKPFKVEQLLEMIDKALTAERD